jgi:hypothetical protein
VAEPVQIYLSGCDDTTTVTVMLTAPQLAVFKQVAAQTREAGGGCQPVMNVGDDEYTEWLKR